MSIIKGTNQIVAGFGGTKRCIGEVYFSQSSLATDNPGALPGWTGEYYENGKTLFPDLYNFVKAHSELQVTKAQYDSAIATYGECPKYVVDENTSQTSLRLPKYQTTGRHLVKKEVNGNDWYALYSDGWLEQGGISTGQTVTFLKVFANTNYTLTTACEYGSGDANNNIHLEYANNGKTTTGFSWAISIGPYVKSINWEAKGYAAGTPIENIQYPWISAYTSAIPASMAQAAEFQQGLSGKADTNLGNIPSNYDYVVESYKDDQGNWYRKYKSGWLEQGGGFGSNDATDNVVTLLKPYANTTYSIMVGMMIGNDGAHQFRTFSIIAKTISTITIHNSTGGAGNICQWEAKGQGAE